MPRPLTQQQGVALVIVLVLLTILTMLALAGAATASAELAMAGHEQYRELASAAASSGIEQAMSRIRSLSTPMEPALTFETASSTTRIRYAGDEVALPQSSAEKLVGRHYVIESTGRSEREAMDQQVQGALSIVAEAGTLTFGQLGNGLEGTP